MPFPIRRMAVEIQRESRKRDSAFAQSVRQRMLSLEDALKGAISRSLDDLYLIPSAPFEPLKRKARERMYLRLLQTPIDDTYTTIQRSARKHVESGFFLGANMLRATIAKLYPVRYVPRREGWSMEGDACQLFESDGDDISVLDIRRMIEIESISFNFGGGTVRDEYKSWVEKQLRSDLEPGSLIKTLSAEHVTKVRGAALQMLDKGESFRWAKDEAFKNITGAVTDPDIRTSMENNIMRIVRTSYNDGVNADTMAFAELNSEIVSGLMRVADGRPCLACVLLDGTIYRVGQQLPDHPMGMCTFVPILKTPTEMGLKVPPAMEKAAWGAHQAPFVSLRDRFFTMPDVEKAKVFGNQSLFDLWKKEKFPIDAIVLRKNGMTYPASTSYIKANLPEIGSISYPKAVVIDDLADASTLTKATDDLLVVVDPIDRSTFGMTIFTNPPTVATGASAIKFSGGSIDNSLPWWKFNEESRRLKYYIRKASDGRIYYMTPNSTYGLLVKNAGRLPPVIPVSRPPVVPVTSRAKISDVFTTDKDALLVKIDPIDRDTKGVVIFDKAPSVSKSTAFRYSAAGVDPSLTWDKFNVSARGAGLYVRKATDGTLYFVTPASTHGVLVSIHKPGRVLPVVKKPPDISKPLIIDIPPDITDVPVDVGKPGTVSAYIGTKSKKIEAIVSQARSDWNKTNRAILSEHLGVVKTGQKAAASILAHVTGTTERHVYTGVKHGPPPISVKKLDGAIAHWKYDDTMAFDSGHVRSLGGNDGIKVLVHEMIHAYGSSGWSVGVMEGFTESFSRVLSRRYGASFTSKTLAYATPVDFVTRLAMVASNFDKAEAARFLRGTTINATKGTGSWKAVTTALVTSKIEAFIWSFGGIKKAFNNSKSEFLSWFSEAMMRISDPNGIKKSAYKTILEPLNDALLKNPDIGVSMTTNAPVVDGFLDAIAEAD